MLENVYRRSSNMVFREIAGELILVPIRRSADETDNIFVLNETGAAIWRMMDGKSTLEEIITSMLDEFEIDRETLSDDVTQYVNEMVASEALEEV
jgi:methyltransferase-like protein